MVWEAKTTRDDSGWTAEMWIPFSQLRFDKKDVLVWGLNIHRYTPTLDEEIALRAGIECVRGEDLLLAPAVGSQA